MPRSVFSEYVDATLAKLIAECPPGMSVDTISADAVSLRPCDRGYRIDTDDRRTFRVDGVVLAMGALPPVPLAEVRAEAIEGGSYLADPWQRRRIVHVPRRVVVLGSGSTAVDVILTAATLWPNARIIALSRHGCLPARHHAAQPAPYPCAAALIEQLRAEPSVHARFRAIRDAVNEHGFNWRAVIDSLRPVTTELWRSSPDDAQRRRFLRHVRWAWDAAVHRMPPQSAEAIEQLQEEGRLTVLLPAASAGSRAVRP